MLTSELQNSNYINMWPCIKRVIKDVLVTQSTKNISQTITQKEVKISQYKKILIILAREYALKLIAKK